MHTKTMEGLVGARTNTDSTKEPVIYTKTGEPGQTEQTANLSVSI